MALIEGAALGCHGYAVASGLMTKSDDQFSASISARSQVYNLVPVSSDRAAYDAS